MIFSCKLKYGTVKFQRSQYWTTPKTSEMKAISSSLMIVGNGIVRSEVRVSFHLYLTTSTEPRCFTNTQVYPFPGFFLHLKLIQSMVFKARLFNLMSFQSTKQIPLQFTLTKSRELQAFMIRDIKNLRTLKKLIQQYHKDSHH